MLHPEEDLYETPESSRRTGSYYADAPYMEVVIAEKVSFMKKIGLPFTAFRGAFFGLTDDLAAVLKKVGLQIDLSSAPGIARPERMADWTDAPSTAYYMSPRSYRRAVDQPEKGDIFEIPLGWDEKGIELSHNYLFHERSTYTRMCKVWDAIVERSAKAERPQFVNFLCHTYSMGNARLRTQCQQILNYMQEHHGVPVTASEAKQAYDNLFFKA